MYLLPLFLPPTLLALTLLTPLAIPAQAPDPPWLSPVPFPVGAIRFEAAKITQTILRRADGRTVIQPTLITVLPRQWHQSGGMEGIVGFRSEKYKLVPVRPNKGTWHSHSLLNSITTVEEKVLAHTFGEGTEFHDVLINTTTNKVFEHRRRMKIKARDGTLFWSSKVLFSDVHQRPPGYAGLRVTCASCHDQAGSGNPGQPLIPGSDTVISVPLPWSKLTEDSQ